ncbi:beta-monoglucosyldiacylglycerol synthase [Rhodobiaceae bacterium]|nr:beta-monoglucosyldiacylglycerol synthase [Rhodobiaceae bacterium]
MREEKKTPGDGADFHAHLRGFDEAAPAFALKRPQLGTLLLEQDAVSPVELAQARDRQEQSGVRLGEELIGHGDARAFDVYRALAEQRGIRFINLLLSPPDKQLLVTEDITFYLQHQCLPWKTDGITPTYVAVDLEKAAAALEEKTAAPFLLLQTAPLDILQTIRSTFGGALTQRAQLALLADQPDASARQLLSKRAKTVCLFGLCMLLACTYLFPSWVLLTLNVVTIAAFISLASLRLLSANIGRQFVPEDATTVERISDRDLPLYTIMVPLLQEADVLPILMDAIQKLDYPLAKLDIKLVLEETDQGTIDAARNLKLPGNVELILVPTSHPLTKPKACNYALAFARGEFLVVYDAEDIPGPAQLREAVQAFKSGGLSLACVQAPLAYYNWDENWLTRHFAIEYASLFDLLLPVLARFGLPFPLGGTSTHFRTYILKKAGAWDPYNVTEDADLGFRLCEHGYKTGVISTATLEEANCLLPNWVRQRSRWLKGWMQTYIVRMRKPLQTYTALGPAGFVVLQIVTGGFLLSALAHPLFYFLLLWMLVNGFTPIEGIGPMVLGLLNLSVLFVGFGAAIIAGLVGAQARGLTGLGWHVYTMPIYWLLISTGAYKALYQLFASPHYWEKTVHGVSAQMPAYAARARRGLSDRQ